MRFPYGETVTRLRATPKVDPYSGEETGKSWTTPDRLDIPGAAIAPGDSSEPTLDARNQITTTPIVYTDLGVDVLPGDRLVVRGRTFEVDGYPAEYAHPFTGWQAGAAITLKEVSG